MDSITVKWNKSDSSLFFYFVRFWIFTHEEKDFESRTLLCKLVNLFYCYFYLSIGLSTVHYCHHFSRHSIELNLQNSVRCLFLL